MKFKFKFKKEKQRNEYKEIIEDLQYDSFSKEDNFITFEQITNNSLLENNLSKKDKVFAELFDKIDNGIENRLDFVLKDFVVTWIQNRRFSKSLLVPAVANHENPNIEAVNLLYSTNKDLLAFFTTFNQIAKSYIYDRKEKVEILPNIVVYQSGETKKLKIAFDPQIIK